MPQVVVNMKDRALIDISSRLKMNNFKLRHAPYLNHYAQAKTERKEMTNLLQENIEIESQRTNSTFGFLPTHRQTQKKPKELFFANAP